MANAVGQQQAHQFTHPVARPIRDRHRHVVRVLNANNLRNLDHCRFVNAVLDQGVSRFRRLSRRIFHQCLLASRAAAGECRNNGVKRAFSTIGHRSPHDFSIGQHPAQSRLQCIANAFSRQ